MHPRLCRSLVSSTSIHLSSVYMPNQHSRLLLAYTSYSLYILGPHTYLAHDDTVPTKDYTYPVRIRYSDMEVPGEISNSYRRLLYGNYKDHDQHFGPINAITELNGWLCSIQDDSINRHYVNEKQIQEAGLQSALILGTGAVLPANFMRLSNFGSQHLWSVTKIGNARYGVDWNKRTLS